MSARDLKALLNTPELFIFLPVVNYTYLYVTVSLQDGFIVSCIAGITSALIYNILDGVPTQNANKVRLVTTLTFILGGVAWFGLLLNSAYTLYIHFQRPDIFHEVLFFVTIVFISVVITNLLLYWIEEEYKPTV